MSEGLLHCSDQCPMLRLLIARTLLVQDLCTVFQSQRVDGAALQSLYRAGAGGGDFLHALIREEFGPEARLVHRLRLLEGLQELFSPHPALEPNTSSSGEGGSQ